MQRLVCPDTESWTMVGRLISVDVEGLGNVQWWTLVSQYTFRPVGENNALRGGDERLLRGGYVGHRERSGAAIFLTPDGLKRGTRIARMMEHERWDRVFSATCTRVSWQLRLDQRMLARLVVFVAGARCCASDLDARYSEK